MMCHGERSERSEVGNGIEAIRALLDDVRDPEIPAISITDLGIMRDVRRASDGALEIVLTPTYSGCPATKAIQEDVEGTLREHGVENARVVVQLAPAWTTEWITQRGRERLRAFGIAPPEEVARCPRCSSASTRELAHFGSTPCKALYRCNACNEPFDYFKRL